MYNVTFKNKNEMLPFLRKIKIRPHGVHVHKFTLPNTDTQFHDLEYPAGVEGHKLFPGKTFICFYAANPAPQTTNFFRDFDLFC